jgi:hypothetical protein
LLIPVELTQTAGTPAGQIVRAGVWAMANITIMVAVEALQAGQQVVLMPHQLKKLFKPK